MSDDPFYSPTYKPLPARMAKPGELLFEFHLERTHRFYRVELREHGSVYGPRCNFSIQSIRFSAARFGRTWTRRGRREMAISWAEEERKAMETA
jgi:hypothetical protein